MTINRIRHQVYAQVYGDTAYKDGRFTPDPDSELLVATGFQRQVNADFSIAALATESLGLGDVSLVRGIYIKVDADCIVRLNGSLDSITLRTPASGTPAFGPKLFMEADITQVQVENISGSDILTGVYCMWGDPSP